MDGSDGGREAASQSGPLDMSGAEFRRLGHDLVDRLADFIDSLPDLPAGPDTTPRQVRERLGQGGLPQSGADAAGLLDDAAEMLIEFSRINGHPKSWGYVIGSPAPIGMLGDFLASSVNPNLAAWSSSPVASEIETQAVRWVAELLGYPEDCGGLLTSGGNMANFVGFLAARRARAGWNLRQAGMAGADHPRLCAYVSEETHTWIQKAADLFGLGTDSLRWISTDSSLRMRTDELERRIAEDLAAGHQPFLVVGSAGTVSTGAVDPLPDLAAIARDHGLWFHVDGAYGALVAALPDAPPDLLGLRQADSLAVDAHKWLYAPLEAGCALVRDRQALLDTFSYRPPYYHYPSTDGEEVTNFYELGPQNSRCFRALKVWLILRQAGRAGYQELVDRNLRLARELFACLEAAPDIEAVTQGLSIATFRYIPPAVTPGEETAEAYLNELNAAILTATQRGGEAFLSNAVIEGSFLLRACITNFRTTRADVEALPGIIRAAGERLDRDMRPAELGGPA